MLLGYQHLMLNYPGLVVGYYFFFQTLYCYWHDQPQLHDARTWIMRTSLIAWLSSTASKSSEVSSIVIGSLGTIVCLWMDEG